MTIRSTITVLALAAGISCAGTALASSAEAATIPGDHVRADAVGDESPPTAPATGDWHQPLCLLCWIPGRPSPSDQYISPAQAS